MDVSNPSGIVVGLSDDDDDAAVTASVSEVADSVEIIDELVSTEG